MTAPAAMDLEHSVLYRAEYLEHSVLCRAEYLEHSVLYRAECKTGTVH
jgi:hypothetical protein